MNPILIGYFPKRTFRTPDWTKVTGVGEVCSVSNCMSRGPEGWIDRWLHNDLCVYDSPGLAWSVVPEAVREEYDLYAYRMYPWLFQKGRHRFEIPPLGVESLADSFGFLGVDAVSRSCGSTFECSPLSCNGMAGRVAVNRHCLFDDVDAAFRWAAEFDAGAGEPGPYHVLEVWRDRRGAGREMPAR